MLRRIFSLLLLAPALIFSLLFPADKPDPPSEFVPVLRFAAASDVHMKEDKGCREYERFTRFFTSTYAYADTQEYTGVDAFVLAGDNIDTGKDEQWANFNEVIDANLREESELLICYAKSHDRSGGATVEHCEEMTGVSGFISTEIKGFRFITLSEDYLGGYGAKTNLWLGDELRKAEEKNGDMPIFVFQHQHIFGTVYGSGSWGTPMLTATMMPYSQIINFSGHSHYPVNDPRSADFKYFTAFGDGTLSYFELEDGMVYGSVPPNAQAAAQFYIVEADADGNVRVMPYNLLTESFFGTPGSYSDEQLIYYINRGVSYTTSLYTAARYFTADSPVFPDGAELVVDGIASDGATITFTQALDAENTHSYRVTVRDASSKLVAQSFKIFSEFYFEPRSGTLSHTLAGLEPGTRYTVSVTAIDSYGKTSASPLSAEFTTAASERRPDDTPMPS